MALAKRNYQPDTKGTLNGVRLHGSILNDVRATRGGMYGTDGYMRYEYTSDVSD